MLLKDIRHLPLLDEDGHVVGIVSIKDLVKAELKEKQDAIKTLSDFALGKGGHFSAE
jgi:CBS domain-containing protein